MPLYDLLCRACGDEMEIEQSIHDALPTVCGECSGEVVQVISPPRTVGVGADPAAWAASDREFDRDAAAYRRLRKQGVQPKSVGGSAIIEAGAETKHEVEHKRIFTDKGLRRRVDRASTELGL